MAEDKNFMDKVGQIGGLAGNVINGIQTVAGLFRNRKKEERRQDERQLTQQGKLNDQSEGMSKRLADYENDLKMQMWRDTNYGAQMDEAVKAGLSKVAVLGGSSGGGATATGASVTQAGGSQAANAAAASQAESQAKITEAQIKNLNADTAKKEAESGNIAADTELKGLDAEWKNIDNKVKSATADNAIDIVASEAARQIEGLKHDKDKTGLLINTFEERVGEIKNKAIQVGLENLAIKQGIELDQARVKEIANNIIMRSKELDATYAGQTVSKENMEQLTNTMLVQAGIQATGQILKGFTDILMLKQKRIPTYDSKIKQFKKDGRINKNGVPMLNKFK